MAHDQPRVALVLGAGGSVGHAFHLGVLSALADELGWDARTAELIVGTSAGSVVAAGLRAGLGPADMRARALGRPLSDAGAEFVRRGEEAIATVQVEAGGDVEAAGRMRMASPGRVMRALREPWRVTPGSLLSAVLPPGRLPTHHLGAPYDTYFGPTWPDRALWIVAVRLDLGTRVVFGGRHRRRYPHASVGQAVQASCAVPGYFAPVVIGGDRFVDGGVHSTTNADVAGRLVDDEATHPSALEPARPRRPDLVLISAPMSPERIAPQLSARGAVRQFARRALASEVAALREAGVDVVTFQPDPEALALMSGDTMDPAKAPAIVEHVSAATRRGLHDPELADRMALLGA